MSFRVENERFYITITHICSGHQPTIWEECEELFHEALYDLLDKLKDKEGSAFDADLISESIHETVDYSVSRFLISDEDKMFDEYSDYGLDTVLNEYIDEYGVETIRNRSVPLKSLLAYHLLVNKLREIPEKIWEDMYHYLIANPENRYDCVFE